VAALVDMVEVAEVGAGLFFLELETDTGISCRLREATLLGLQSRLAIAPRRSVLVYAPTSATRSFTTAVQPSALNVESRSSVCAR
jgi:hypothetical protein